jgi:hypothetical protein
VVAASESHTLRHRPLSHRRQPRLRRLGPYRDKRCGADDGEPATIGPLSRAPGARSSPVRGRLVMYMARLVPAVARGELFVS